ncbi:MAG: hypothetical protein AAFQ82_08965, partial [Myxococcota bacterium]
EFYGSAVPEDFLQSRRRFVDRVEKPLLESKNVVEVAHVPRLMTGESPSLAQMREAAALMQAELLLIYRTRSQLITDHNVFSVDEIRSQAVAEVMLMDVRSGAIPYSQAFEANHVEAQSKNDASGYETRKRADLQVTDKVLNKMAEAVTDFLSPDSAAASQGTGDSGQG